jgi:hypothetical protein
MIRTLLRIIAGIVLACLAAGLVLVMFVITPAQLAAAPGGAGLERVGQALVLALLAATHATIFAGAFALITAAIGEWFSIRALPYYLLTGSAIALLGFLAQFSSEAGGQPTIFNNYALQAYLTAGFFGGLAYWLVAGQHAGSGPMFDGATETASSPASKKWAERPRIIVEKSPPLTKLMATAEIKKPATDTKPDAAKAKAPATPATSVPAAGQAREAAKDPAKKN